MSARRDSTAMLTGDHEAGKTGDKEIRRRTTWRWNGSTGDNEIRRAGRLTVSALNRR
jgi:hypothetical protein